MKKVSSIVILLIGLYHYGFAQKTTFDIASFSPPAGWERSENTGELTFTTVDSLTGTLCFLTVYNSLDGSGDADTDFKQQWNAKMVTLFGLTPNPDMQKGTPTQGWDIRLALDTFSKGGATYIALLTVMSGYKKTVDILAITNDKKYFPPLDAFYKSIELQKPATPGDTSGSGNKSNIVEETGGLSGIKKDLYMNYLEGMTAAMADLPRK